VGTAGSQYGELRTALRTDSYRLACQVAKGLPRVDLRDALQLTMLAASKDPDRYEALARRWLARFLEEKRPTLQLVKWVAGDLESIGAPECPAFVREDAEARLLEIVKRL
jgi:hypothetical protein